MRTWMAAVAILVISAVGLGQGCRSTVRNDIYILPPAEFATTQAYPDMIILENELISVSIVPNRGRILFDYVYKPTGHSQLYHNYTPLPLLQGRRYFYEFGGYYASLPWNTRDNQPDELSYELVERGGAACSVKLWGKDFATGLFVTVYVGIKAGSPMVDVTIELSNPGEETVATEFYDVFIALPGGDISESTQLLIPVDRVVLGPSEGSWMGEEGVKVAWPQPWREWGRFLGRGEFRVTVGDMRRRQITVYNPMADESFIKSWDPLSPYGLITVSSWGPKYEDALGAFPGFSIKSLADLEILPGETEVFRISFWAAKGRP